MTAIAGPVTRCFTAAANAARLDRFLTALQPDLTRSRIHALIAEGMVTLNGKPTRPAQKVQAGDRVALTLPPARAAAIAAQPIPLSVIYQDAELLVVDKPAGLPVHPGPGHPDGTLVNGLLAHCPDIQAIGGVTRPGIVHRLDRNTSGLLVVAKTERAHHSLSGQLKARQVRKGYLGLALGRLAPPEGLIDAPIGRHPRHRKRMAVVAGGRAARTRYRVKKTIGGCSLLKLCPETGRTHQLRVHLASLGHPLYGDAVYGKASPLLPRHFLHASILGFRHPVSGQWLQLRSQLPPELEDLLSALGRPQPGRPPDA